MSGQPGRKDRKLKKSARARMEHWHIVTLCLMLYDIIVVNAAYFLALWLRFDCSFESIADNYLLIYMQFVPIYTALCLCVFWCFRLYKSIWRFASINELGRVVAASAVTLIIQLVGTTILCRISGEQGIYRMPVSYYAVGVMLQFLLVLGIRFSYRVVLLLRSIQNKRRDPGCVGRVMLIGAGAAGQMILHDLN